MIHATKLKYYMIIGICAQDLMDLRFDINSLVPRKYERPKKKILINYYPLVFNSSVIIRITNTSYLNLRTAFCMNSSLTLISIVSY